MRLLRMHRVPLFVGLTAVMAMGCARKPASPPSSGDAVVAINKHPPRVGRVAIEEATIDLRLSAAVEANGGVAKVSSRTIQHERKREEILSVFERIVTKKRVTYEQLEKSEFRDGAPIKVTPNPLLGHVYVIELKNFVPIFSRSPRGEVSDDERAELVRRSSTFGKADPFLEGIPDGPLQMNQPAPGMSQGFLETFEGGNDGPDIGKVSIRFAGAREHEQGRCGVFAFGMDTQLAGEPSLFLAARRVSAAHCRRRSRTPRDERAGAHRRAADARGGRNANRWRRRNAGNLAHALREPLARTSAKAQRDEQLDERASAGTRLSRAAGSR